MVRCERLPNGVTLLLEEVRIAPVVALATWVGAGSADEPPRLSGVSHFLEHMLLKERSGRRGPLAETVQDAGGYLNARTGCDHTAFYQVVPSLHWRAVLEAQVETLARPHFDSADVDRERSVIVEETRMADRNPHVFAWRRLMETALAGSGYGRPIPGTEESLGRVDGRALTEHLRQWYGPWNVVQVVVGDVAADEVIERSRGLLGRLQGRERHTRDSRPDAGLPRWTPGAVLESGCLRQPYLAVGFRTPAVRDPDVPVLDVLCSLLGVGRSSRLRKTIQTGEGLVSDIGASVVAHRDVGILAARAVGTTGASPREIVASLFRELGHLSNAGVTMEEMRKSVRRLEAAYLLEHETVETIAMTLGFFETMGDHGYAEEYVDRLAEVTPGDIRRAARKYLRPEAAAIVAYVPEEEVARGFHCDDGGGGSEELLEAACDGARAASAAASVREAAGPGTVGESFTRPQIVREEPPGRSCRRTLSNDATLVVRESSCMPLVSVAMAFRGGFVDEPDSILGITGLTLKHMLRGTRTRSAWQLADDIESLGSSISVSVDRDGFGVGASVLSKHLNEALAIICEAVRFPALDVDEFEGARHEALADVGEVEDRPFQRAMLRLVPSLFPHHPYGRPIVGTVETLSDMTTDLTGEWHKKRVAADRLFVCMTGDVAPDTATEMLERALEGLQRSAGRPRDPSEPGRPGGRVEERLNRTGQSSVAVGFRGPSIGTRESAAMHVACAALTMMGGRLWSALRERPPFAYSVRAVPVPFREGGAVVGYATAPPGQEDEAVEAFTSVLSGLGSAGLSEDELERGKRYVAGMLEISMQRGSARAASYAMAEVAGVGHEHVDRLPGLVRGITNDDVVRVAGEYLTAEDGPAVAVLRG